MPTIAGVDRIGIVGTGTIGASWAALCLSKGLDVVAHDVDPSREQVLRRFIDEARPALEALGPSPGHALGRLRFETDLEEACADVQFVQENAPEVEAMKVELIARIDRVLPREAIISSSSSALLISRLQAGCRFPERVVLGHPFNPPHIVPLVEVVRGEFTSSETAQKACEFYRGLGKTPILLAKEINGHVANRIQAAVFREAVHLLAEGVATLADIDAAIRDGPGLRWALMGPFLTFHLGGGRGGMQAYLEHFAKLHTALWAELGNPELTEELKRRIIEDTAASAPGCDVDALVEQRDAGLLGVLAQ
jgi:3-hydroxyacyl-CoA dehydrogenase